MSYYSAWCIVDTSFGIKNVLEMEFDSYEEAEEVAKEVCQTYQIIQLDIPFS